MRAPRLNRLPTFAAAVALSLGLLGVAGSAQAQADIPLSSLDGSNGFQLVTSVAMPVGGDGLGATVSGLGDLNGDGIDDMAITAPQSFTVGTVYVVYGQAADFPAVVDLAALDGSNGFRIDGLQGREYVSEGLYISRVGDLNGDGIRELVISDSQSDPAGRTAAGTVYVLYGGSFGAAVDLTALDGSNGFRVEGVDLFDQLRSSSAVDINGDGRDDLALCAHGANTCYVLFGHTGSVGAAFDLTTLDGSNGFRIFDPGPAFNTFGWPVIRGDFNGDGVDDLAMGSGRSFTSGSAYVLLGRASTPVNPTPFAATIDLSLLDGTDGFRFTDAAQNNIRTGFSLANPGDLNGDGIDDLLVGAPFATVNGLPSAGRAYVLYGSASGFPAVIGVADIDGSNGFLINGTIANETFGWAVAAGDLNGDGRPDLAIGANSEPAGAGRPPGNVYLFLGRSGGFPATIDPDAPGITLDGILDLRLNGVANGDYVGNSLSMDADINHDGVDDLIVGAPALPSGGARVYVFLGNGPPVLPTGADGSIVLLEDAVNTGRTIAELLPEGLYLDTQPLAGAAIDSNAPIVTDGVWQYRLAADQAWVPVPTSGLSTSNALLLPPEASLRFLLNEPQDVFGAWPGLLLRPWDGAGASGFSFGTGQDIQSRMDGRGLGGFSVDANRLLVPAVLQPVNDAPSFTASNPPNAWEDAGAVVVNGWASPSAGPDNESSQALTFVVTSLINASLFSVPPSVDPAGNLSYELAPGAFGSAFFSLRVEDDGGTADGGVDRSPEQSFVLQVIPSNDAPQFTAGADPVVDEDTGAQTVNGWATGISAGPPDEAGQTLTFNVTGNTNPALFSVAPAVDATGTLTYTVAPDANGTATITLTLSDNGAAGPAPNVNVSAAQQFTITVNPINDAPSFSAANPPAVARDAGPQAVVGWASGFVPGPVNEAAQQIDAYLVTDVSNPALFATPPSVSSDGTLSYAPAAGMTGSSEFSVAVRDDGGTGGGGIDTSAPQQFTLTVNAAAPMGDRVFCSGFEEADCP